MLSLPRGSPQRDPVSSFRVSATSCGPRRSIPNTAYKRIMSKLRSISRATELKLGRDLRIPVKSPGRTDIILPGIPTCFCVNVRHPNAESLFETTRRLRHPQITTNSTTAPAPDAKHFSPSRHVGVPIQWPRCAAASASLLRVYAGQSAHRARAAQAG